MRIAYYDETGDDGYPQYSSPFFVLSALYLHYQNWQAAFETIRKFRQDLRDRYGLPIKVEFHTKALLLNKRPYRGMGSADRDRVAAIGLCCDLVAALDVRVINVVIVKPRIVSTKYDVLDTALTYSLQRIENDLDPVQNPEAKFLAITDEGRVGKMRSTARRIQRINYIPSKYSSQSDRREIRTLIEDPLPKDSRQSYFIQLADLVSYVTYLFAVHDTGVGNYSSRVQRLVDQATIEEWMERLKPSLNLRASGSHRYGVVYHPK